LMHTSGWLGPTCLSEWHTASLLIPSGGLLAVLGAGELSLDHALGRRMPGLARRWPARWSMGGAPSRRRAPPRRLILGVSVALLAYMMGTNQVFHGGVWGPLHNHSTVPGIEVGAPVLDSSGELRVSLYRDRGPETWGAHVVEIRLVTPAGEVLHRYPAAALRSLDRERIVNVYVNEVQPGPHALEVPLGARATVALPLPARLRTSDVAWRVEVAEVGGLVFRSEIVPGGAAGSASANLR
ncbi:MAG TPA: TQO small subunit DoxA domain-containing protein, partial [Polyangiaceae bacterium LLY-WYZ-14_1]|nr:TQO small subunit DoxA domain-containing protein [Polyangiaceae bacterium LLY-WYZ-14_1]